MAQDLWPSFPKTVWDCIIVDLNPIIYILLFFGAKSLYHHLMNTSSISIKIRELDFVRLSMLIGLLCSRFIID